MRLVKIIYIKVFKLVKNKFIKCRGRAKSSLQGTPQINTFMLDSGYPFF